MTPRKKKAFTLIELLVVIAIIAVLIGLLLPAVQKVREAAARTQCQNNLKQLALAVHSYHDAYKTFPCSATTGYNYNAGSQGDWSWLTRILPYIEQQVLYQQLGVIPPSLPPVASGNTMAQVDVGNTGPISMPVKSFLCPADPASNGLPQTAYPNTNGTAMGLTSYKGVCGDNWEWSVNAAWNFTAPAPYNGDGLDHGNGIFYRSDGQGNGHGPLSIPLIKDGTSNTLMIGEDMYTKNYHTGWPFFNYSTVTCAIPLNAVNPATNLPYANTDWPDVYSFHSNHPNGANFATADASVHYITNDIDLTLYRNLATFDGGEQAGIP